MGPLAVGLSRVVAVTADSDLAHAVPWKATDAALAVVFVLAGFVVILLGMAVIGPIGGDGDEQPVLTPWLAAGIEGVMLAAVWLFGINKYRVRWRVLGLRRPAVRRSFTLPLLVLLGSLGFTGVYTAIVTTIGAGSLLPSPLPAEVLGSGINKLLNITVIVVWGPFAEEAFFRGFLLTALVRPLGVVRAAVVSSAIFAATHLMLSTMIPVFVTGLLLSWVFLKSRSLWPPLTAHVAQNLIVVSVAA